MRIQEMRSGITHLKKKMEIERPINYFEKLALVNNMTEAEKVAAVCELDEAIWSVVSFERCEAHSLTYEQAAALLSELDARGVSGLCIITDDAALRVRR
ncbi:MAG: hypothetical protein WBC19_13500 [Pyrinomonadaceae bacterium]|nr:hypothetical protein [Chloracidobacterium sp.]MBP7416711.1 hypothetical protein [Pyrinomonadaceae bacterium]